MKTILNQSLNELNPMKYIDWVRLLPCVICLKPESDPHHINKKGHGSMAKKASDSRTIPLCRYHHTKYHQIGRDTFASEYEIDYEHVIDKLNTIWRERENELSKI